MDAEKSRGRLCVEWMKLTDSVDIERSNDLYEKLRGKGYSKEYRSQIDRDVNRTFPTLAYFGKGSDGEETLRRVLNAYAIYNPTIGYVQGMNMLVGYLLDRLRDEETAFWVFVSMMHAEKYDLLGLFTSEFPKMHCAAYQIDRLLKRYKSRLRDHMLSLNVEHTMYLCKWLLQLYTNLLEPETLRGVWQRFIEQGWTYLISLTFSILEASESELLKMKDFYEVASFLTADMWKRTAILDAAVKKATEQPITSGELKQLELEYLLKGSTAKSTDVLAHERAESRKKGSAPKLKSGAFGDQSPFGNMDWELVGKVAAGAALATAAVLAASQRRRR